LFILAATDVQTEKMRSFTVLPIAFAAQALAQTATAVTGNPVDVLYKASLPEKPFFKDANIDGNVRGFISGQAAADGNGITFTVQFENLPKEGGPFGYHLHAAAAVNGNCTSTKAHLDPFGRGQQPPCDPSAIETCEVGDLSGKYGKITSDPFTLTFTDKFASTKMDSDAFFGDKSFVIHYANTTRLTCANFEQMAAPPPAAIPPPAANCTTFVYTTVVPIVPPTSVPVPTGTEPGVPEVTTTPVVTPTPPVAAAASVYFSVPLLLAGLAASFFAL
jgi:hypothetical protein